MLLLLLILWLMFFWKRWRVVSVSQIIFSLFFDFLLVSRASSLCHACGDVHWYFGVPGSVIESFYTILVSKVIFIWFSSFYWPDLPTTVVSNYGNIPYRYIMISSPMGTSNTKLNNTILSPRTSRKHRKRSSRCFGEVLFSKNS